MSKYSKLDKDKAVVLLVDHQAGLLSLVRDFSPDEFKNNVLALADIAKFFKLPTILTTSFEQGPNGPLVPELKQRFPDAPYLLALVRSTPGTMKNSLPPSKRPGGNS
jgi:nicotinamidase-related amidase